MALSEHNLVRPEPRITANELARFMVSGDTGRLGIIRRARESGTPPRTRYKDARATLCNALTDAASERRILREAKTLFDQRAHDSSQSAFIRDDAEKSLQVIKAYQDMRNQMAGYDYVPAPRRQPNLQLGGIEVSVSLDLLIHRSRGQADEIGGVLFRLTQADDGETDAAATKRKDMGAYAATLVQMHVAANLAGQREPAYQLCWSVDVQAGDVHVAPRNFAQRAQNMDAACKFIGAMWGQA